ncbi:adenylate/guanylate cyclase domain-containing protein [Zavarzinella formosa]|uniref:adenylate/guanylate cyclase domain-containing protein n=1 Tax=Zavarzinella formosa TaxID=360055 RepID=UPI0003660E6C|nr:adenylate/guanylate cyclase domain-containing protein [Zavarzinella formosa]
MAELEARIINRPPSREGSTFLWCRELPDNRRVSIGRTPLTNSMLSQSSADSRNRSEWVVADPDRQISGLHAWVFWDPAEKRLHVERKTEPTPTREPIWHAGSSKDNFRIGIGETFRIGKFSFQLHDKKPETADQKQIQREDMTNTLVRPLAVPSMSFRQTLTPDPVLVALNELPGLIGKARKEQDSYQAILEFVISIVPLADMAAVIDAEVEDAATGPQGGHCRVAVRQTLGRRAGVTGHELRVSRSLAELALFTNAENTLWARNQDVGNFAEGDSLWRGATDWAVCVPLFHPERNRKRVGLYIAGMLPPSRDLTAPIPPELLHSQAAIDLVVQIYKSVRELLSAKEKVTRYEHYLPKRISEILTHSDAPETRKPRETDVTVLFCDLRGSSRDTEGSADLMNEWRQISDALSDMTAAIINNAGVVGDLVGDAAMGFWGWPFDDLNQVLEAARAAFQILHNFQRTTHRTGRHYRCGIGIAHGRAVAGEIGPFDFRKFGVFGPVVNLASRLEGMTKLVGVPILIDENAAAFLRKCDPEEREFQLRPFPVVQPDGMTVRTTIHELARPETYSREYLERWQDAVWAFQRGNWNRVTERLDKLDGTPDGADPASRFLRRLMEPAEFRKQWDGVIRLDKKS